MEIKLEEGAKWFPLLVCQFVVSSFIAKGSKRGDAK